MYIQYEEREVCMYNIYSTVQIKGLTMFSGALHLLHHFKSNLAHLLEF